VALRWGGLKQEDNHRHNADPGSAAHKDPTHPQQGRFICHAAYGYSESNGSVAEERKPRHAKAATELRRHKVSNKIRRKIAGSKNPS
jgi:hypothetical protein